MAIESFKILYKLSPKYLHNLLSFKNTNYSFGYENLVSVPRGVIVDTVRLLIVMRPLSFGTVSGPGEEPPVNVHYTVLI